MNRNTACPSSVALPWRPHTSAFALLLVAFGANAHDTWFESRGQHARGDLFTALGTGNAFPVFDSPVGPEHLQRRGCREGGKTVALSVVAQASNSLILRAQTRGTAAASCWAQLISSEVELKSHVVPIYFSEAQPPAGVIAAWSAMEARGLPWKERYTKHARIVFNGEAPYDAEAGNARPDDMGLDMMLVGDVGTIREADIITVQVLRDGRTLPDFAVELRHVTDGRTISRGAWHKTDDKGRVRLVVPQAGRWLLRGIDIRKSDSAPDSWDTRFVTLAFEVAVAPRTTHRVMSQGEFVQPPLNARFSEGTSTGATSAVGRNRKLDLISLPNRASLVHLPQ